MTAAAAGKLTGIRIIDGQLAGVVTVGDVITGRIVGNCVTTARVVVCTVVVRKYVGQLGFFICPLIGFFFTGSTTIEQPCAIILTGADQAVPVGALEVENLQFIVLRCFCRRCGYGHHGEYQHQHKQQTQPLFQVIHR